ASWQFEGASPLNLVTITYGEVHKHWQMATVVEAHVDFHGALRALVPGPRKQRQSQLDQRGIERDELGLEAQPVSGRRGRTSFEERAEERLVDICRLLPVDASKTGPGDRAAAEVVELPGLCSDVADDVAQAGAASQLRGGEC